MKNMNGVKVASAILGNRIADILLWCDDRIGNVRDKFREKFRDQGSRRLLGDFEPFWFEQPDAEFLVRALDAVQELAALTKSEQLAVANETKAESTLAIGYCQMAPHMAQGGINLLVQRLPAPAYSLIRPTFEAMMWAIWSTEKAIEPDPRRKGADYNELIKNINSTGRMAKNFKAGFLRNEIAQISDWAPLVEKMHNAVKRHADDLVHCGPYMRDQYLRADRAKGFSVTEQKNVVVFLATACLVSTCCLVNFVLRRHDESGMPEAIQKVIDRYSDLFWMKTITVNRNRQFDLVGYE